MTDKKMCNYELTIAIALGVLVAILIRWWFVPRLIRSGALPKEENMTFKNELPIIFVLLTAFVFTVETGIWMLDAYCK